MIEQFFVPTEGARKKVLNLKIDKNCAMVAEQFSVTTEGTTISSFCLKSQKKTFSCATFLSVTRNTFQSRIFFLQLHTLTVQR